MKKFFLLSLAVMMAAMTLNAQMAYLLTESAIENLPDEEGQKPEQNAANWFKATYVDTNHGQFVSLSQLKAGLSTDDIKVLWINIDRTGLADLAAAGIDADAVAQIKAFVEAGGDLLLTKQAAHLAYQTGRIGYAPGWNSVGYHDGGDTWFIKTKLGTDPNIPTTDRSNHAIYKDIAMNDNGEFPLVGAVRRSDRNNNWGDYLRREPLAPGQETHYDNANILRLQDFESDWNCQALATWPHIQDYCLPMVIDFLPNWESFQGGMLAICLAAYQWGTANNDATNFGNVKKLTENSLVYLLGYDPNAGQDPTSVEQVSNNQIPTTKVIENGVLYLKYNGAKYNVLGTRAN